MLKLAGSCNLVTTIAMVYSIRRMFNSVKERTTGAIRPLSHAPSWRANGQFYFIFTFPVHSRSWKSRRTVQTGITGTLFTFLDRTEGCIELHFSGLRPLPGARPWNVFHHPLNTGIASHMVSTQQAARGTFQHRCANFQH